MPKIGQKGRHHTAGLARRLGVTVPACSTYRQNMLKEGEIAVEPVYAHGTAGLPEESDMLLIQFHQAVTRVLLVAVEGIVVLHAGCRCRICAGATYVAS
jgi:predicted transcriptional regulator